MRHRALIRVADGGLLLIGLLTTAACGPEGGARPAAVASAGEEPRVTDSAGVQVRSLALGDLPLIQAEPTGFGVVGPAGGEAELHRVRNPFRSAAHGLVVPNAGTHEVRFYDGAGRFLRSVGREGDAPGEYRGMAWVRPYRGDSVAVYDELLRRLTVLDRSGRTGRTLRPRAGGGTPREGGPPGVASAGRVGGSVPLLADVYPDGSFLGRIGEVSVGPGDTTAVRRDTVVRARYDADGHHIRDVVRAPDDEHFVWAEGGSRSAGPLPFGRTTDVATLEWTTAVAANDGYQVVLVDSSGATTAVGRVTVEALPVTDVDVASHRESSLGEVPEPFRQNTRRALDATPFPERTPWHGELVAADGRLWLERYRKPASPEAPEWVVFDPDGTPRARVRLPHGARLTDAREDTLVAVTTDDLDVERITLLTWEPPGGP